MILVESVKFLTPHWRDFVPRQEWWDEKIFHLIISKPDTEKNV